MKEGNRVSNKNMKKILVEEMLLGLKESYEVFMSGCLMKASARQSPSLEKNHSVLKAVNTQAGYWKAGTVEKRVKNR